MDVFEAIHARQSLGNVKTDAVPRAEIERLLEAAVQAPNHYKVRPWRFVVVGGEARNRLGEAMAQGLRRRSPQVTEEVLAKERVKPLRAPLIIAVGADRPSEPKILEIENICAAAAACENLLLAAAGESVGGVFAQSPGARRRRQTPRRPGSARLP